MANQAKATREIRYDKAAECIPDAETNGIVPCTGNEGCVCDDCVQARAGFDAWCSETDARWQRARSEGKVAHLHPGVTCRVCFGDANGSDPRDTSIIPAVRQ